MSIKAILRCYDAFGNRESRPARELDKDLDKIVVGKILTCRILSVPIISTSCTVDVGGACFRLSTALRMPQQDSRFRSCWKADASPEHNGGMSRRIEIKAGKLRGGGIPQHDLLD